MDRLAIDILLRMLNIQVHVMGRCRTTHPVIISNHVSELDPVVLLYVLQNHRIRFVAGADVKHNPMFKVVCDYFDVIWLGSDKRTALDDIARQLRPNDAVCIFPEGTLFYRASAERSHAFCRKTGRRPFKHVLAPREAGFSKIRERLKPHGAYTDITLVYDADMRKSDTPLVLTDLLNAKRKIVKVWIEETDSSLTDAYRRKDILIGQERRNGRMEANASLC